MIIINYEEQLYILNCLHAGCRQGSELLILKRCGTGGPPLDDSTPWQISQIFACLAAITVKTVWSTILVIVRFFGNAPALHGLLAWESDRTYDPSLVFFCCTPR